MWPHSGMSTGFAVACALRQAQALLVYAQWKVEDQDIIGVMQWPLLRGDGAEVGMHFASGGAAGAGLQRTQPLGRYATVPNVQAQLCDEDAAEVIGDSSGLLLAAQPPTLRPGKRIVNMLRNDAGQLLRLSPMGSHA